MQSRILFLSQHDTTSGPMAAAYLEERLKELQDTEHVVCSAGVRARRSDSLGSGARQALEEDRIPIHRIGATLLTYKDIQCADLIVCLSEDVRRELRIRFHFDGPKAVLLMGLAGKTEDVHEPKSASLEANRGCLAMMKPALDILAQRIV